MKDELLTIPKVMAERALWSRKEFLTNPLNSQIDDNCLIWCLNKQDGLWYSILGNYSHSSPEERRKYKIEYEKDAEKRAKEIYEEVYYRGKIRLEVLARDKNTCQICYKQADSRLHIHHILKRIEGGGDYPDNLLTVCGSCHKKVDTKLYNPEWK